MQKWCTKGTAPTVNGSPIPRIYITSEMGDVDVQQPVDLPIGSTTLNDTFDLHRGFKEDDEPSTPDQEDESANTDDEDDDDDWLLQEELAKLKAEWDDYVENLEGELDLEEDYPPVDMKERLRQLNEEWGAEEVVERTNTKVNFSEKLVTLEVPPPAFPDENAYYSEEVIGHVSVELNKGKGSGAGDEEEFFIKDDERVRNDATGEGYRSDDFAELYAKKLNFGEEEKEDVKLEPTNEKDLIVNGQINVNESEKENSESTPTEITKVESKEDNLKNTDGNEFSGTNTPDTKEEQVLIERDGKFELKPVSELSAEERDMMGISASEEENRNSNNGGKSTPGEGEPGATQLKNEAKSTPPRKQRPATATTYQSLQKEPVQKRRIQSAKSATSPGVQKYDKPEGYSSYGLSPEQKELKRKQLMQRTQKLQEKRQKEEEEKKQQQEEAESAFQAWLKRKQQDSVEKKKLERQKRKGEVVKTQKDPKEAEETYEAWLKSKKDQAKLERKVNRQKKKEDKEAYFYRSRNECDAAFKEWMKTKKKQLREDSSIKRAGANQTTQAAQKSRKARNLSKALQLAQDYKYTEYYGYRF